MDMRADTLRRGLVLGGLYLAGAMLASLFLRTADDVTLFWPASGIAFAATVRYGLRWALLLPLVLLPFHLLFEPVPGTFLFYSLASNMAATWLAGWYVLRRAPLHLSTRDGLLLLRGGLLLCLVSASIGALGLVHAGMIPKAGFGEAWLRWALGDLLGITAVAPSLLLLRAPLDMRRQLSPMDDPSGPRERAIWVLLLALSFVAIYLASIGDGSNRLGLVSLPMMLLLWSAMRFSAAWTALSTLLSVIYISLVTGLGLGGFSEPSNLLDTTVLLSLIHI